MKVHHHTILCCGGVPLELQDEDGTKYSVHPYWGHFELCRPSMIKAQIDGYIESFVKYNKIQEHQDIWCVLVRWDSGHWAVWCGTGKAPKVLN